MNPLQLSQVDQFVPSFARHDAIGNHVLQLRRLLREAGYQSDIYFEHLDPALEGQATHFSRAPAGADPRRLIIYHASTHSSMTGWLQDTARSGQAVAMDYHNITPARYFARWDLRAARSMEEARDQLAQVLPSMTTAVADSAYNRSELDALGHPRTGVCPLLVDFSDYHQPPDPETLEHLGLTAGGAPLWLFVGRVAPNKCQHDVIGAFAVYRRLYKPSSRLALVGSVTSIRYQRALESLAADLGVADAVDFVGSAPLAKMLAYFRAASVFVCLSEHEGFCIPVIEAMELGVPVVAYSATAVTDTVAGAGRLLTDKDPLQVAAAVDAVISDPGRTEQLVAAGRQRAAEFHLERTGKEWMDALDRLAGR